eukprot:72578-Prymnesium_polylepis.2
MAQLGRSRQCTAIWDIQCLRHGLAWGGLQAHHELWDATAGRAFGKWVRRPRLIDNVAVPRRVVPRAPDRIEVGAKKVDETHVAHVARMLRECHLAAGAELVEPRNDMPNRDVRERMDDLACHGDVVETAHAVLAFRRFEGLIPKPIGIVPVLPIDTDEGEPQLCHKPRARAARTRRSSQCGKRGSREAVLCGFGRAARRA